MYLKNFLGILKIKFYFQKPSDCYNMEYKFNILYISLKHQLHYNKIKKLFLLKKPFECIEYRSLWQGN